jgi:uncharacterized protein YbjT (DUF2867 family)
MKIILFGGTGMVGRGVLRECLLAADVSEVLSVVRRPSGETHPKLRELVHADFTDFRPVADALTGFDACFWCLGVSSFRMNEAAYTRVTYDFTVAAAQVVADRNPNMTFVFVSGQGSDSTEQGRVMWARVKGRAENALARMPFKAVYILRPGFIQPLHGISSRTRSYRVLYAMIKPFMPLIRLLAGAPRITTTEAIGRAMLIAARRGAPVKILGNREINALGGAGGASSGPGSV